MRGMRKNLVLRKRKVKKKWKKNLKKSRKKSKRRKISMIKMKKVPNKILSCKMMIKLRINKKKTRIRMRKKKIRLLVKTRMKLCMMRKIGLPIRVTTSLSNLSLKRRKTKRKIARVAMKAKIMRSRTRRQLMKT